MQIYRRNKQTTDDMRFPTLCHHTWAKPIMDWSSVGQKIHYTTYNIYVQGRDDERWERAMKWLRDADAAN